MKVKYAIKNAALCSVVALLFSIALSGMEAVSNLTQALSFLLTERGDTFQS